MAGMVKMVKAKGLLVSDPPNCAGSGVVIGGGGRYLSHAWAVAKHLRNMGWDGGIQVWHLGQKEMPSKARPLFSELDVELKDAEAEKQWAPIRILSGWTLKCYAVMRCPWRQVMFVDADCFPVVLPQEAWFDQDVQNVGTLFFSDVGRHHPSGWGYRFCGLRRTEKEWETGQFIVDKVRGWMGLRWAFWLNEHADVWYKILHGDKGTFEMGFRISDVPHLLSTECAWKGYGIEQSWKGRAFFRHCMAAKRGEHPWPDRIGDLFYEWTERYEPEKLALLRRVEEPVLDYAI